jgi:glutamyl-tRNA synthetase
MLEEALRQLAESRGVAGGKLFQPLRLALTGMSVSPGIFDVLMAMGRERSLARVDAAVARLDAQVASA